MNFYISPVVLGTENFLEVTSEGFSTSPKLPPESWLFSGSYKNEKHMCLDSLLRLAHVDVASKPADKWIAMMNALGCHENIPWSQVMPSKQYKTYVKNIVKSIVGNIKRLPEDYYANTWWPCGPLFSSFRPSKIDTGIYKSIMDESGVGNGALESFKPGSGGFAQPVTYDRFGTRTGRLTVDSGPNILTLKKEHRKILKSYYPSGSIVSLDFSALEARVLLYEAGHSVGNEDVYSRISTDLFGGAVKRDVVKVAVLSELYGASRATLGYRLEMSDADLDRFIAAIKLYFRTDELKSRLKNQLERDGRILNRFGRPLYLEGSNVDHLLINTYAQSTGADISLLGFSSIVKRLGTDGIRPLFLLHDALILDVNDCRLTDVEDVRSLDIPGYDQKFYLKFETI